MLVDKNEVMYYIEEAISADPNNARLQILKTKVASMHAAVIFICNGEACETEFRSCRMGGPEACTHTSRVEYAENFEPVRDQNGNCYGFREKEVER